MKRENAGAKPTAPPRLPPEAEQEILEALFEGMEIHSSEIAAILKKHGVCGDVEALQDSYRKRLGAGQRKRQLCGAGGLRRQAAAQADPPPYPEPDEWAGSLGTESVRQADCSGTAGPQVEKGWLRWTQRHSMSSSPRNWTQGASSCTSQPKG